MTAFVANNGKSTSMCIYTITHRDTGKVYVGQTRRKASVRWSEHLSAARRCTNKSHLYAAINKYGKDAFDFAVIDIAESIQQLDHKERFWIAKYGSFTPEGFNLDSGGSTGKVASAETREKLRQILTASPIVRKGVPKSEAHKLALSEAKKGSLPWNKGKKASEQALINASLARLGKPSSCHVKRVLRSDGVVFEKMKDAAEALGVHRSSILDVIKGRRNSVYGYKFSYLGSQKLLPS